MNDKVTILTGGSLPNMPWQDRPADDRHDAPVWRYSGNPVIGRNPAPGVARIFNSAVAPYGKGYIAVLRGEQVDGVPHGQSARRFETRTTRKEEEQCGRFYPIAKRSAFSFCLRSFYL